MADVFGIDISSYDTASNWNAVRNQGVRFVFVKASENTFADTRFVPNWQGAKGASMYRGAFHFFHSETNNAAQQANTFIQTVGTDKGELPPILDVEPVLDSNKKDIQSNRKRFVEPDENLAGCCRGCLWTQADDLYQ